MNLCKYDGDPYQWTLHTAHDMGTIRPLCKAADDPISRHEQWERSGVSRPEGDPCRRHGRTCLRRRLKYEILILFFEQSQQPRFYYAEPRSTASQRASQIASKAVFRHPCSRNSTNTMAGSTLHDLNGLGHEEIEEKVWRSASNSLKSTPPASTFQVEAVVTVITGRNPSPS